MNRDAVDLDRRFPERVTRQPDAIAGRRLAAVDFEQQPVDFYPGVSVRLVRDPEVELQVAALTK